MKEQGNLSTSLEIIPMGQMQEVIKKSVITLAALLMRTRGEPPFF